MKLGQFTERSAESAQVAEEAARRERELAATISVGSRCQVTVGQTESKRGTVMFVGIYRQEGERERQSE